MINHQRLGTHESLMKLCKIAKCCKTLQKSSTTCVSTIDQQLIVANERHLVHLVSASQLVNMKYVCLLLICGSFSLALGAKLLPLTPTKISENGDYKLEIQSEDKFLTSGPNGTAIRARWSNKPEQKWRFSNVNGGWMLKPTNGEGIPTVWKISYVGHGKYRFLNEGSGLCFAGSGSNAVGEKKCEKDSPYQRWLVVQTN